MALEPMQLLKDRVQMKTRGNAVSWVAVLMAASSLLTMICLFEIDKIVHNDLYRYGLHFSLQWATPYWTMARIGFTMGWLNIIAAITVQLYTLAFRRKEVEELVTDVEKEMQKHEITPSEKAEEKKNQDLKPTQTAEKPKDTYTSVTKSETPEKQEEKPTTTEDKLSQGKSESEKSEKSEDRKEPEPATEQKETKPEPPEKNEESPILAGVSEEEISPVVEQTPQQATPTAS